MGISTSRIDWVRNKSDREVNKGLTWARVSHRNSSAARLVDTSFVSCHQLHPSTSSSQSCRSNAIRYAVLALGTGALITATTASTYPVPDSILLPSLIHLRSLISSTSSPRSQAISHKSAHVLEVAPLFLQTTMSCITTSRSMTNSFISPSFKIGGHSILPWSTKHAFTSTSFWR